MSVIERMKDWVLNYLDPAFPNLISRWELLRFLKSLASERCVWKVSDSPYYYWELSCHGGGSIDQANTSWEYCPYCGKRIEVKEEGNG
jgi:DNA-directed RNA polymerase subunit RPC12/RpoP